MITHTTIRELIPMIYLTNIISPLYVYCHQHQNMIKGMIALSISPFLVVDDNIHIAPQRYANLALVGASFNMNSPQCVYIESLALSKMHKLREIQFHDYET